jgi:DNA-directed RNA polymerase specialized sigma24 family protein
MGESAPANDRGQFLRLFLEAERDIHRYICAILPNPQDARDVLQETALALWEEFDQYDVTRPFVPWAVRFALNKARQQLVQHCFCKSPVCS